MIKRARERHLKHLNLRHRNIVYCKDINDGFCIASVFWML